MDDELKAAAKRRHDLHVNHPTHRPLSKDYEDKGLCGEAAFGALFGLKPDLTDRRGGDGGQDFRATMKFRIDVKTAEIPKELFVERGKIRADIYVLAKWWGAGKPCTLLGWAWAAELLRTEARDRGGMGVISHGIEAGKLRPMRTLLDRIVSVSHARMK